VTFPYVYLKEKSCLIMQTRRSKVGRIVKLAKGISEKGAK
jgi:hypothetical protein